MKQIAIVLGAAVRPDGTASVALERRALTAAKLYSEGRVDQIIASGGVPQAGRSEADLIAEICAQKGVPSAAILIEDASRNTVENVQNSMRLLESDAEVTLVTDRYHALRARIVARDLGLITKSASPSGYATPLPRLLRGYLREGFALAWYLLRRVTKASSQPSP